MVANEDNLNRLVDSLERLEDGHERANPGGLVRCDICDTTGQSKKLRHYSGCPFRVLSERRRARLHLHSTVEEVDTEIESDGEGLRVSFRSKG